MSLIRTKAVKHLSSKKGTQDRNRQNIFFGEKQTVHTR